MHISKAIYGLGFCLLLFGPSQAVAETTALWLFDEHENLYPSCVLFEQSPNRLVMVLGPGGQIVEGRFGNALEPIEQWDIDFKDKAEKDRYILSTGGEVEFGLQPIPPEPGRTVEPMNWLNADFSALMTTGENHLRKNPRFSNATEHKINLGDFDWTVEFWYRPMRDTGADGVVFEIGSGPRGENDLITKLSLNADLKSFTFLNQPSGSKIKIPSDGKALNPEAGGWHHLAFVYNASEDQLRHYVDGKLQALPQSAALEALGVGEEAYFSVGRDGTWQQPLQGRIDELRFSDTQVYEANFTPPGSFSVMHGSPYQAPELKKGLPLLFGPDAPEYEVLPLGSRKHLFIDDAIVAQSEDVTYTVNPPRKAEKIGEELDGHMTVMEDEDGLIRLYLGGPKDSLAVMTSHDGVHFEKPDLRSDYMGWNNIVIKDPVGYGSVFIDPNAPPEARWKYFSGIRDRGVFVYYSKDGWTFTRNETSALPYSAGSQSIVFYDEQAQVYRGYHRSDFASTPGGYSQREFRYTEVKDVMQPWPFRRVTREESLEAAKSKILRSPNPWYLDNGPLTPGGFGIEYPTVFEPREIDPLAVDIYVPKNVKYAWAPDTYLAFPLMYFHYWNDGPETRQALGREERGLGSGPVETQLSVSRDGFNWKRYARPTYVGIGRHGGLNIIRTYFVLGMIRRGDEIWQYYQGRTSYHSPHTDDYDPRPVFRLVQRLDGFVSADTPYDRYGTLVTRPLTFAGNRLVLNIDTDAAGYAQVGFLDAKGAPIPGYSVDDCVYINGDFVETEVEFLNKGTDLSALAGKPVQVVFRMRGTKLYSMQFVEK